ncbi:MAG: hypothetical protein GF411_03435 [Candidatus Lokiarchaeota archaeon]|nr:hypothetical protein [Candidatus Lokiarchaeota archaeon]
MEQTRQYGYLTNHMENLPNPEVSGSVILAVAMPVIIFSILSLGFSIVMLIYAVLTIRSLSGKSSREESKVSHEKVLIPESIAKEITSKNIMSFLESLLTEDEVRIIIALAKAIVTDRKKEVNDDQIGLRNKYQISTESNVEQRVIYSKAGPIDRLVEVGIIMKIGAEKQTGGQKYLYVLSKDNSITAPLIEIFDSREEVQE